MDLWEHHDTSPAAAITSSPTADALSQDAGHDAYTASDAAAKTTGAGSTKDNPGRALGLTEGDEHEVVTPPGRESPGSKSRGKTSDPSLDKDPKPHNPDPSGQESD